MKSCSALFITVTPNARQWKGVVSEAFKATAVRSNRRSPSHLMHFASFVVSETTCPSTKNWLVFSQLLKNKNNSTLSNTSSNNFYSISIYKSILLDLKNKNFK